jgi:hypothetical protein
MSDLTALRRDVDAQLTGHVVLRTEVATALIACAEALDSVVTLASHSAEVAELAFREARAAIAQLRAAP